MQSIAVNSTAFEGEENGPKKAFIGSKTETALLVLAKDHLVQWVPLRKEKRANTEVV